MIIQQYDYNNNDVGLLVQIKKYLAMIDTKVKVKVK